MLILLPPSETKREGGSGAPLDLAALSFPELSPMRRTALAALRRDMSSVAQGLYALRLPASRRAEVERDREVRRSPTLPAIERYTGVLYDALDAATLAPTARDWVDRHVVVHSALLGLVRAGDPIPAYRLSHDARLTGTPLKRLWAAPVSALLAAQDALVLDLRSEAYAALGPAPAGERTRYLRVVAEAGDGARTALAHDNKAGKGALVRALADGAVDASDVPELLARAAALGIRLEPGAPGELDLVTAPVRVAGPHSAR